MGITFDQAEKSVSDPVFYKGTFDVAARTTIGTKNGKEIVDNHKAHVIVSTLSKGSGQGSAIFDSMGVVSLTEILAEAFAKPLGFFWSPAETLIGVDEYKNVVAKLNSAMVKQANKEPGSGYDLPATYWVGYRLFQTKDKKSIGTTSRGLNSYFGFEVELAPEDRKPGHIAASLYSVISFLFANGPVLKAGETIEVGPGEIFQIHQYSGNQLVSERIVLKRVDQAS